MEDVYWRTLRRLEPLLRVAEQFGADPARVPPGATPTAVREGDYVHGAP
jgi:hypothetical protein